MGKIKKILENELVGGTQSTDVYPITSTKAVYDENNKSLDNIIKETQETIEAEVARLEETDNEIKEELVSKSEIPLVDEDGFHIIDKDFNVGMKYDEEGFDAAKVSTHFIEVLKAAGISTGSVMTAHAAVVNEDGFFITDESLNVGIKVDDSGIHAKNILEYEIVED